jgi:hypothetical protein
MTREHYWPEWLIDHTNTVATGVKWSDGKKINPKAATFPLCYSCNQAFGAELESPMKGVLLDLEAGRGISDYEAELVIRWLWKFEGLAWLMGHPKGNYSPSFQLRDRVLHRLGDIRNHLSIAISLIASIDSKYGDSPLGLCSVNNRNAIFVSAVFSKVAMMCFLSDASSLVPPQFSIYRLLEAPAPSSTAKLFFPKTGFLDCTQSVGITRTASSRLDGFHETIAQKG